MRRRVLFRDRPNESWAVPGLRCATPLRFVLRRARDTDPDLSALQLISLAL